MTLPLAERISEYILVDSLLSPFIDSAYGPFLLQLRPQAACGKVEEIKETFSH